MRSTRTASRFLCLALALVLLPSVGARAQTPDRTFGEIIDVRIVNLEVVVTDKDGNRVTGLHPSDFELLVDGEPVAIDYFSEILDGLAEDHDESLAGTDTAPSPIPSVAEDGAVPRWILLFVDNYFGIERDRDRVLHEIRASIGDLEPEDRMAIVAFDGDELTLVTSWTAEGRELDRAFQRLEDLPANGLERLADLRRFDLDSRRAGTGLIQESDRTTVEQYLRKITTDVEKVTRAATSAMRTFSGVEGRRIALMLSGGWPREPSYYATGRDDLDLRSYNHRVSRNLDDLTATANLLGFSLYPVDVPGYQSEVTSAAELGENRISGLAVANQAPSSNNGPPGQAPLPTTTTEPQLPSALSFNSREFSRDSTLVEIAEETGGLPLLNGGREGALGSTLIDTSDYYWLGFTPERRRDDVEHEIEVRLRDPKLQVRTRAGYRDLSRTAEVDMRVESQLLFSSPIEGLELELEVGEIERKRRRWTIPFDLEIPMDQVVMLPTAQGYEARMELRIAALDEKGGRSEMPVIPITFGGPAPAPPGSVAHYETKVRTTAKEQRLVLALYDLVGESILSTTVEVR